METIFLLIIFHQMVGISMSMRVNMKGISLNYTVASYDRCQDKDRFRVFLGYSVAECVAECGLRPHCKALNFIERMNMCELFSSDKVKRSDKRENCLYVKRSHIKDIKTSCADCKNGEVCDTSLNKCKITECVNITKPANGTVLGNRNEIGNIIRYKCDKGFIERNGIKTARCLENGTWNATAKCIRDCGEPQIANAHISNGRTFKGSVRNVTCYNKKLTDVNNLSADIHCMKNGSWTPAVTCSEFNNVVFRVIPENGVNTFNAWNTGKETTDDVMCRDVSNETCRGHYRDPRIDKWNTLNVQTVRYSIYKNNSEIVWILFNGTGSNNVNWFQQGRIIDSSYSDLRSNSDFNYFEIDPVFDTVDRPFYVSVFHKGCENDDFYFVTIDGHGSCWYDQYTSYPRILYSLLNTSANTGNRG